MRAWDEMRVAWQLPKHWGAGKLPRRPCSRRKAVTGGTLPGSSSPSQQLRAVAVLGEHLLPALPAWHFPHSPSSSPPRLTLRSGAWLMTGLIDL